MRTIVTFYFLLFSCCAFSQNILTRTRKIVQLYEEQTFYLNGEAKVVLGGKSRVVYDIILPSGTVEWYYSVTTFTKNNNQPDSLHLLSQLAGMMDSSDMTNIMTSAILAPRGAYVCDCYLMNEQSASRFMQMADITTIPNYRAASRENYSSGVVQVSEGIQPGQDTYQLGFRNPGLASDIGIRFEAVAIVEEASFKVNYAKARNYLKLGIAAYEANNVNKCIEYCKQALSLDNKLTVAKLNMGLCYLFKGDESTATDLYIDAISEINAMKDRQARQLMLRKVVNSIDRALIKQPHLKGANTIKSLFQS